MTEKSRFPPADEPEADLRNVLVRHIGKNGKVVGPRKPSEDPTAVLDMRKLRSVVGDVGPELRADIIDQFRADVEKYASMVAMAVEEGDSVAFEKATHGITGVAGMFGANELAKLAEAANTLIRRSQNNLAYELHSAITKSSQGVLEALKNSKHELSVDETEGDEKEMPE